MNMAGSNPFQPIIDFYEGLYRQKKEAEEKGDIVGQIIPDLLFVDVYRVLAKPEERTPENLAWAAFDVVTLAVPVGKAGKVVKLGKTGGKMFESLILKMAGKGILKEAGKIAEKIGIKEAEKTVAGKSIGEVIKTGTKEAEKVVIFPIKQIDKSAAKKTIKYTLAGAAGGYIVGRTGTGDENGSTEDFWDKVPIVGDVKRAFEKFNQTVDRTVLFLAGLGAAYLIYKLKR